MMSAVEQLVTGLVGVSLCFGGYFYIDGNYAKATTVQVVEARLDRKILEDDLRAFQKRLWQLEAEKGKGCRECKEVEAEIELIKIKLKGLKG